MFKKVFFIIFFSIFLSNCGYKPLLMNNRNEYKIEILNFEGDRDVNNLIKNLLTKSSKIDSKNIISVDIKSDYSKIVLVKNSKGTPTDYELKLNVSFKIKGIDQNFNYSEKFSMLKNDDILKEKQYEQNIKKNLAQLITNKFVLKLSDLK